MSQSALKLWSLLLSFVLLVNMFPMNVLAESINTSMTASTDLPVDTEATVETEAAQAYIVEEIVSKRSEYSKEYRLSNGLHMATMYAQPVHYEAEGKWEEIDNTLKLTDGKYTNTAGVWDVSFPQQLSKNSAVSITRDGYTLSFYMAGELRRNSGNLEVASVSAEMAETLSVRNIQAASAQIQQIDLSALKAAAQHPETVSDKLHSRLQYEDVYTNTDIRYDLQSNQVKESIIMDSYDSSLRGYQYTLDVGKLVPVLTEGGEIQLYSENRKDIVMVMPAPFLLDNGGEYCDDVTVTLEGSGSAYTLTYLLPQAWLVDSSRQWPVVLDPVVNVNIEETSNTQDASIFENGTESHEDGSLDVGHNDKFGTMRTFIKFRELPELSASDVITSATIRLTTLGNYSSQRVIEAHKVLTGWESKEITWDNQPGYNTTVEDYVTVDDYGKEYAEYEWEITDVVRGWYEGENTGVMFKAQDHIESTADANYKTQFASSEFSSYSRPTLAITFRNNNGLESYWDYTSSSAGRAGTGYVNNYTGNLVWVHSDIGFGGNRMPISISHVYNANDILSNTFGMGNGWRTNFNQRVYQWSEDSSYYVWEDADGTKHYFQYVSTGKYKDEDGLELTLTTTGSGNSKYAITDKDGNASYFDTSGRLRKQENDQATTSCIEIAYSSGNLISTITDGAGRKYNFTYTNGLLSEISYTGTGSTKLSYVLFSYTGSNLVSITDKDQKSCTYTYNSKNLLTSASDIDGYKLTYGYNNAIVTNRPSRVSKVCEYDGTAQGGELTFSYANNQTSITDGNGNTQIMQFNNWGNTVSIQDGEGRAQYAKYATDSSSTAKGNQLTLSSKLQNTVGNLFNDSSFENGTTWTVTSSAITQTNYEGSAYCGSKFLKLTRSTSGSGEGVYGPSFTVKAGESYTFSAYLKTGGLSAHLELSDGGEPITSGTVAADSDWTRVEVTFTAASAATVTPRLLVSGSGSMHMDCVQLEKAVTASRYNLVENGDFRDGSDGWSRNSYCDSTETTETLSQSAAPQLDNTVFKMEGDPTTKLYIQRDVDISIQKGDTFVLSAWAKGDAVAQRTVTDPSGTGIARVFAVRGVFLNADGTQGKGFIFRFNPDADNLWQYRAGVMVADAAYSGIRVQLIYNHNCNTVYFDGVQLFKEEFGNSYTYDDEGNVVSVKDLQGQITQYEYTNNNLTKEILPSGAELTYTYDSYGNVKTATSAEGVVYEFTYDTYGNNTSVSIVNGSSKITSTATYSSDGNRLVSTTDTLGNTTTYSYNANTNVLEWVLYPKNTAGNRTNYTYDEMYRLATASVYATGANGSEDKYLTADYTYENDLLTKLETQSTTYSFAYGDFALRSSVQVGSKTLASYTYTDDGNNYLKKLAYGNGDSVEYLYDKLGRVMKQTYEDDSYIFYRYDNSGALARVTNSSTWIFTSYFYDFTDRLVRRVEKGNDFTFSIGYAYDEINNLSAVTETFNTITHTVRYGYDEDNRVSSMTHGAISQSYSYDGYGRTSTQTTKVSGTAFLTEAYTYNTNSTQVKTYKTTVGGKSITLTYTYDANGNIASVSDGTYTTSYSYDTANQLYRENNEAEGKTWVWVYDNAGNITQRREYPYTTGDGTVSGTYTYQYADSDWGDLLTAYHGRVYSYDEIGNPLSDGLRTYTWINGREMHSVTQDGTTFFMAYNADGLRTKRVSTSTAYNYYYSGSQLRQMYVNSLGLYFRYDANGTPLSVTYGGTVYYYITNLQGDVTAIVDGDGTTVVAYTYDAWGKILSTTGTLASTLGKHNPLRYRGYIYDAETELYYLQSRYYDPEIGRFINADGLVSTGQGLLSSNMFTYCYNNPVMLNDETGTCPHNGRFYTSGPFEGQFEYDPNCFNCAMHGEFWVHDSDGNSYDLTQHDSHVFEQMAICTDGGEDAFNSNSHQNMTAYSINGEYMDPTIVKYVVAPVGYSGVSNGDLALVLDLNTGESFYAVVGDRGPKGKYNEVSLCVAWDLGYDWADGSRGPKGNFQILYFPGTKKEWHSIDELVDYLN